MPMNKKAFVATILLLTLLIPIATEPQTNQSAKAETANSAVQDKLTAFLNEVLGIDSSSYELTTPSYGYSYPSTYGGLDKEELASFTLNSSDGDAIHALSIFDNGYPSLIDFSLYGSVATDQQYSTNTLEKVQSIILRYQTFAQNYSIDTSEIAQALNMLSNVATLTTSNVTQGNMKMEITVSQNHSGPNSVNYTKIAWIYTIDGVDATRKSLSIEFDNITGGVEVDFGDAWGFWSVADTWISEAEATSIAWNAAKNYNVTLGNPNTNSTTVVAPDWGNNPFTQVGIMMAPGQGYNNSLDIALNFGSMGNITRNGLTLYPLWQFMFYFNQSIGDIQGIEVGVWGDTGEIAYCSSTGDFGVSDVIPTATSSPTVSPTPSTPELPAWVVPSVFLAAAFAAVTIAKRKKPTGLCL